MVEKEKEVVVKIDLGTTNSCKAILDKYKVELIQNDYGKRTTFSIAHFYDQNNYSVVSDSNIFINLEQKAIFIQQKV